jgi:hypothetical protein
MDMGDDPFADLFKRSPRVVDIQAARVAGR